MTAITECDGYTLLLANDGVLAAARWLPMPMLAHAAAEAAAEWAADTGCEVKVLYRGVAVEALG